MYHATRLLYKMFVLTFSVFLLSLILSVPSAIAEEDIWTDEPPARWRRMELTDERAERMLKMIGEKTPERAAELRRLRKEDPDKFKEHIWAELAKVQPPRRIKPQDSRSERDSMRRGPGEPDAPG